MTPAFLVPAGTAPGVDPDRARREAEEILSERRFSPQEIPRPLRGVLDWIGDRLEPVGNFLGDVAGFFADAGSSPVGFVLIAAAVIAVAAFLASRLASRAGARRESAPHPAASVADRRSPDELERAAEAAERAGELDTAVRLRFRAGLLRLDETGAIAFRPSITSGEVRRRLHLRDFELLALDFDEIAYGGRPASAPDVERARLGWPRVVHEAGAT